MLADTTVCIAASVEAKTFGVKTGTKVADARKLCPGIEFVVARHEIYIDFHHRAVAVVDSFVPVRAVLSIDEMDCELTGRWREPERALEIAHEREGGRSRAQIGECLRTSIGIGPNTFIAKTASDMVKPDGLVMIEKSELPERLFDLRCARSRAWASRWRSACTRHGIRTVRTSRRARRTSCARSGAAWAARSCIDRIRGEEQHERESDTALDLALERAGPRPPQPRARLRGAEPPHAEGGDAPAQGRLLRRRASSIGLKYLDGAHWARRDAPRRHPGHR